MKMTEENWEKFIHNVQYERGASTKRYGESSVLLSENRNERIIRFLGVHNNYIRSIVQTPSPLKDQLAPIPTGSGMRIKTVTA